MDDRPNALLLEPAALDGLDLFVPWRTLVPSDTGRLPVSRLLY